MEPIKVLYILRFFNHIYSLILVNKCTFKRNSVNRYLYYVTFCEGSVKPNIIFILNKTSFILYQFITSHKYLKQIV